MASVGHAPSASGGPGHGGGGGSGGGSAGFSANPLSRPTDKVAPPQKVIKALNSHRSTNPQELSYTQGHFWYVIGEREGWYEALGEFVETLKLRPVAVTETDPPDPITSSRGLVPKEDFEEFNKGGRQAVVQNQQSPTSQQ
jgi:bud emergence protein 1